MSIGPVLGSLLDSLIDVLKTYQAEQARIRSLLPECPTCGGKGNIGGYTGIIGGPFRPCPNCQGGKMTVEQLVHYWHMGEDRRAENRRADDEADDEADDHPTCARCKGTGSIQPDRYSPPEPCPTCVDEDADELPPANPAWWAGADVPDRVREFIARAPCSTCAGTGSITVIDCGCDRERHDHSYPCPTCAPAVIVFAPLKDHPTYDGEEPF